jgi:nicotinate dehydrogenase subunit A
MSLQKKVILKVNNVCKSLELTDEANLLQVLRNDFLLNSPKYGCGLGECGACTVIIDGCAARSCVIPAVQMSNRQITTLEGLSNNGSMHPIQKAFIEQQAAQCGYCLSGMIMMTVALLISSPSPNEQEIKNALSGNLCRCGTHLEILRAVQKAVELTSAQDYTTLTNLT